MKDETKKLFEKTFALEVNCLLFLDKLPQKIPVKTNQLNYMTLSISSILNG
jgi:hypothetical protein|tara:strand:- start:14970 stop:15122 length:153 start_codon:yes stop_codon:yes gene_type:complete